MYGFLLPLDIKGLSEKQNCKSQLNLIFLFLSNSSPISSCLFIECTLNKINSKRFSNNDYSLSETDPLTLP